MESKFILFLSVVAQALEKVKLFVKPFVCCMYIFQIVYTIVDCVKERTILR